MKTNILNMAELQRQEQHNSEQSNDFSSNSFFQFTARKAWKKISEPKSKTQLSEQINNIYHRMITSMLIMTNKKISPKDFRRQLKNYHFRKVAKHNLSDRFGHKQEVKRQQQFLITTLLSVMQQFKRNSQNCFWITSSSKNQEDILYFYHAKQKDDTIQSFCASSGRSKKWKQFLTSEQITHTQIVQDEDVVIDEKNKLTQILVKNQNVNIFWGHIFNMLISKNSSFELVTNYPFINCYEYSFLEVFNGIETKDFEKYEHIAEQHQNILGQKTKDVYRLKIDGLWTTENLRLVNEKLQSMFADGKFAIEFFQHKCTKGFKNLPS